MRHDERVETHALPTEHPDLSLAELTVDHATEYYRLIDRNRDHLTQFGDYSEMREASLESVIDSLSDPGDANLKFGIWFGGTLIGRVDLSPRVPGHFVIGYWLGSEYTGRGYATMSCRALIEYARANLGAMIVYAGVTKMNMASEALLGRLGFKAEDDRGSYTLYRLSLTGASDGA